MKIKKKVLEKNNIQAECITLDIFKKKFIEKLDTKEKGITALDENYFKKENKIVRDLSQVSYRLLNFILYSHLFFSNYIRIKRILNISSKQNELDGNYNRNLGVFKNLIEKKY